MKALVVSLHDVSPLTRDRCERIAAELTALGLPRLSLLVIPNHHARGVVRSDARLCEWLRTRAAAGDEIVTHGYFHQRQRRAGESAGVRWTTRVYTADEGEFYDLSREAAAELVRRGNSELRELGLEPRGFIAPAWLLSAESERALCDLGCEYTTRLRTVSDLRHGRVEAAQSLCWSVRAAWRRGVSRLWNAALYSRLRAAELLRIAVHPPDIEHAAVWRQVRALVSDALRTRRGVTYLDWLARVREHPPAS